MEPNSNIASTPTQNVDGPVVLLKSAWSVFKANWKILIPIVITPSVIVIIGTLIGMIGMVFGIIAFLIMIVGIVFGIAMGPALTLALPKIDNGSASSIKYWSQYKEGFSFFWIVIGLGILQALMVLGSGVIFIIPGIIVSVFIGFYVFARILDGKKGFSSYLESFSLVKGRWWAIFGRMLFFILVYIICAIVAMLIDLLIGLIFGDRSVITVILAAIVQIILTSVLGPLALIYIYKLYNSLKTTRAPAVATNTFKKWLIAFLVIGIIAVVLIPLTGIFTIFSAFSGCAVF